MGDMKDAFADSRPIDKSSPVRRINFSAYRKRLKCSLCGAWAVSGVKTSLRGSASAGFHIFCGMCISRLYVRMPIGGAE